MPLYCSSNSTAVLSDLFDISLLKLAMETPMKSDGTMKFAQS